MKKIIVFLFLINLFVLLPKTEEEPLSNEIRYRIISSSNSNIDKQTKWEINQKIIPILSTINFNNENEITNKLPTKIKEIEKILDNYEIDYNINYGLNYFPEKKYNNIVYPEGEYKSFVITLGNGEGHNWWCFLFPPLCSLELNKNNIDKNTYDFYLKSVINKYL